jgi:transposase-like protein
MSQMKRRIFSVELKLKTLERMRAGESPSVLARELGVFPHKLHEWRRAWRENEGKFRRRGPPSLADALEVGASVDDLEMARKRIADLERKLGQQALELDFFKGALRRIEASRQPKDGPGATASSPRSKR